MKNANTGNILPLIWQPCIFHIYRCCVIRTTTDNALIVVGPQAMSTGNQRFF